MKLYMIRHGESEANFTNTHAGWGAFRLTDKGRSEAEAVGRIIRGLTFDKVYSSDLPRALETQQIALPDALSEQCSLLREINVGKLSGMPVTECERIYGEEYLKNRVEMNLKPYGGEDFNDISTRAKEFMSLLEKSSSNMVAAFSHNGLIKMVFKNIVGVYPYELALSNCGLCVFEFTNGKWKVVNWNYTPIDLL